MTRRLGGVLYRGVPTRTALGEATRRHVILDGSGGEGLSAQLAEPTRAVRGTLVALHGAGMNSRYFTDHALPASSFADVATNQGFAVLCVDRPGYGNSRSSGDGRGYPMGAQVEILSAAVRGFADEFDVGEGFGLLAHSFGGKVALGLAADERLTDSLVSLDISGSGHRPARSPGDARAFVRNSWGPPGLYPPGTFQACRDVAEDVPLAELAAAHEWPAQFPGVARKVRIPVRLTFAEHESWWRHGPEDLEDLRGHFVAAPRVVVDEQPSAGHNISLGLAARAYHLKALAFFEESLLNPGCATHRLKRAG